MRYAQIISERVNIISIRTARRDRVLKRKKEKKTRVSLLDISDPLK